MADLKQGVEYELTAKDATKPGVDSAKATVEEGAKAAAKSTEEVSKEFKGGFSPMAAITAALTGNFNALGQQLMGLASRLKGVHMSMMQFGLYAGLVMALAKAAQAVVGYFRETARQAEQIKLGNAAASLDAAKAASAAFAHHLDEARKNAEALTNALNGELDALQQLTKAQNEFAKAQELALANTDEEREAIETRYKSIGMHNDREVSARRREIERDALDGEIERLQEELESAKEDGAIARREFRNAARQQSRMNERRSGLRTWWIGTDEAEDELARQQEWGRVGTAAASAMQDAAKRVQELERKLADARRRRGLLDVKEETAQYSDAAEMQTELNEAWKEVDDAEKKEIEEIKEKAIEAANEVKEAKLRAQAEMKDTLMRDLREASDAEASAQQRLAAARAAVDRAWGWYRDKNLLKAQLEEEKSEAEAQRQFEKDFEKLKDRRPDWEKAKNLSLDQEAVKRVALARREEADASRAVAETAENTRRAADALEKIEGKFEEGGE